MRKLLAKHDGLLWPSKLEAPTLPNGKWELPSNDQDS